MKFGDEVIFLESSGTSGLLFEADIFAKIAKEIEEKKKLKLLEAERGTILPYLHIMYFVNFHKRKMKLVWHTRLIMRVIIMRVIIIMRVLAMRNHRLQSNPLKVPLHFFRSNIIIYLSLFKINLKFILLGSLEKEKEKEKETRDSPSWMATRASGTRPRKGDKARMSRYLTSQYATPKQPLN